MLHVIIMPILKWMATGALGAIGRTAQQHAAAAIEREPDDVTRRHPTSGVKTAPDSNLKWTPAA